MVPEPEAQQVQVQRIAQSKAFRTSVVQRNLLSYLAEKSLSGTADSLKEYTVGLDVFAKPSSYDPRQESVVRMHLARLRQKLAEYYRTEGIDDPIVVDVPKGGFMMTFGPRQAPSPREPARPSVPIYRREMWLAVALLVAIVCASYLALRLRRVEQARSESAAVWTPELQQLWTSILSSSRPLMVCLATPMFVRVPGLGFVRDSSSNDSSDLLKSKNLSSLRDVLHLGAIAPSYGFTEVGTANGAFLLGQFLAQRKPNVLLTRTDLVTLPDVAMADVVFLGQATGNREIQAIPVEQQFVLEPGGIRNLSPLPGEPALVSDHSPQDPRELEESYALISHLPGLYGNGEILYLSANQIPGVTAAVKAFTDPALARTLVSKMRTASGDVPHYYQIVLKVRSMDDMPVEISYLFHRELSPSNGPLP
jgi:hypothetical protein